jgi:hypothetical protein
VTDGRRRWARITTASSAILLLVAIISLWRVSDEFIETYDPESNYLVKLDPGESETFEIEDSDLLSAVRVSDGETPDSDLTMFDSDGNEIPGKEPKWSDPDRFGADEKTVYSPVRVFEDMRGSYTLQNQGSSDLWLVDDDESADKLLGNFWMYLFYIGCCIGSPVGIVGVILAIMVWTDKRKMPDQFVIIEDGSVIMGNIHDEDSVVEESGGAPSPFVGGSRQNLENPQEEDFGDSWKSWDEG